MSPTCSLCQQPLVPVGNGSTASPGRGTGPRYECRSPGCLGNALSGENATWIGGTPGTSGTSSPSPSSPEPSKTNRSPDPLLPSSTTWIGGQSRQEYAPPRPRAPEPRVAETRQSGDHVFEDGTCLLCGREERLAGRYGWSCPVRLP